LRFRLLMDLANIHVLSTAPDSLLAGSLCRLLESSLDAVVNVRRSLVTGPIQQNFWRSISGAETDVAMIVLERRDTGQLVQALGQPRSAVAPHPMPALVAVLDGSGAAETSALLQAGVADFILPPLSLEQVLPRITRLLPARPRVRCPPGNEDPGLGRLVGRSAAFVDAVQKLPRVARCETGVLIEGESGTGKELFARAIHDLSPRAARPFVPVNCGAIPVELAESELFGHERGAFTGAYASAEGLIAQADGGTLFLDEVVSMPLLTQVKLLRFLQEREYRPIGAKSTRRADVRVIAAANTSLARAVQQGRFRHDLFYRLNVVRLTVPALRERRDDIPLLAEHFVRRFAAQVGSPVKDLSVSARERLVRHEWPGNVRELEHAIERAVVFAGAPIIEADHLVLDGPEPEVADAGSFKRAKARTIANFERSYIEGLLAAHRGNISHAARRAGKNRRAFWELIRKHGVDAEHFRPTKAPEE
jgi:two-component system response regulator GlrR